MNKRGQKWLKLLLLLGFIGCAGMYGHHTVQTRRSQEEYEKAAAMAEQEQETTEAVAAETESEVETGTEEAVKEEFTEVRYWAELLVEDDPYMETLQGTNLKALREVNEDVIGWIVIPETQLDYPLMQGEDNEYYLERNWKGEKNVAGSIFMEQFNDKDFKNFNTVIYGHRMKNGSMFGSLKHYASKSYWEQHPYVYIYDDAGAHRYEIFAAYEATLEGSTYQVGFADDESKQLFLDHCVGYSDIDTGVVPTIEDRIITLSTCTGRGHESRWVVQARRKGEIVVKMGPKQ